MADKKSIADKIYEAHKIAPKWGEFFNRYEQNLPSALAGSIAPSEGVIGEAAEQYPGTAPAQKPAEWPGYEKPTPPSTEDPTGGNLDKAFEKFQEPPKNMADGGEMPDAAAPPTDQGFTNVINPEGNLVSLPQGQVQDAYSEGYQPATPEFVQNYAKQQKYGTPGQQAKTAAEGVAQGLAGPLATGAERTFLGVNPEDIRAREEVNPYTHAVAEMAGFGAGAVMGTGEAALVGKAGEAAEGAMMGAKAAAPSLAKQVTADTVRGAFEMSLIQGGEELNKQWKQDPNQTAASAVADIGLAGILGGVGGGAIGAALRATGIKQPSPGSFISELDKPAIEAGDFATIVKNSDEMQPKQKLSILEGLRKEKGDADEIRAAAKELGAPLTPEMVSDSKDVQRAADLLLNGPPTYHSNYVKSVYGEGFAKAQQAVEDAMGEGSQYSKAELGNIFKNSISSELKEQMAPIEEMYNMIKEGHDAIPIQSGFADKLLGELGDIKDFQLSPSSPGGKMISRVQNEIGNLKTVDDIKAYKTILRQSVSPTAPSAEKRVAAIIGDKLAQAEENSIESFAKSSIRSPEGKERLLNLIEQRKDANTLYAGQMKKIGTLAEQLGKGRVYGIGDALHFINERLSPEEIVDKLYSKKDSEFLKFFKKEFPNEMEMMKDFQKGSLREAASKTGELSSKVLFNNVNKLEPEIKKALFTPEELGKLGAAETYLRGAFPKNFNPSGTAHADAFRAAFEHPMGAVAANARDAALYHFVKAFGASPEVSGARSLAQATVKGDKTATRAIKSIFTVAKEGGAPVVKSASTQTIAKLSRLIDSYSADPSKMFSMNDSTPVPEYSQHFAQTSARAVQYLASIKPRDVQKAPLDSKVKPSSSEQRQYERQLQIAQNPLVITNMMKTGTLTSKDLQTLKAVHPEMWQNMATKIMGEVITAKSKGQSVSYTTRMQLSLFLGQPLDSTMTPQGIMGAQPAPQAPQQGNPEGLGKTKKGTSTLNKLPGMYQTQGQARQAAKTKAE